MQDTFDAGDDTSDPGTVSWISTSKTFTPPHNPHLHHQNPPANILHSSNPLLMVNPSVAKESNAQNALTGGLKMNPPQDQGIMQKLKMLLTKSMKMRGLETALISGQNLNKTKSKEKPSTDSKKRRRGNQRQSEECPNEHTAGK